uniref:Nucleoporin NDC1 n=1 Tax=Homalodisca liturata TaxID=320908 RepID=A0A1B6JQP8_9HEMI
MLNTMKQFQETAVISSMRPESSKNPETHVWRMRMAVLWSLAMQFILLFVFILFTNLDILHPFTWIGNCFRTFISLSVWLKLLTLVIVIYIQGEVCKKDYVTGPIYHSTRFQKICKVFSVRNLLLLLLHMVIGATIFWIYITISGKSYESLTKQCYESTMNKNSEICLVERKFFLMLGGIWLGMYYFANDYMFGSRALTFPLIQQYKFYRMKAALKQNIQKSVKESILPTVTFLILYYLYGGYVRNKFIELTLYRLDSEPIDSITGLMNINLVLSLWLFSSIFIVALQMMELLFNVYLTEHCSFPITLATSPSQNCMSLIDALKKSNIPIVHHLGYLDLFILSAKCQQKREEIFTLSHPGGHPHSWNGIFLECTNLVKQFTSDLNQTLKEATSTEKEVAKPLAEEVTNFHFHSHNMRKLASPMGNTDIVNVKPKEYQSGVEIAFLYVQNWLITKLQQLYKKPYVAYFFLESPTSRINYLLCQCQPVIWAVESLAFLAAASLTEDRYGIVQQDLSEIITLIITLKQVLDKLFKQNLIVKKSFPNDPLDVQMKYLLRSSVKRSLYRISVNFGPYIRDLKLPVDVEVQMNHFIAFKEV